MNKPSFSTALVAIWALSGSLLASPAWAGTALVSDVDDTVRVSHVDSFLSADLVWTLLTSRRAFAGMATLYAELEANSGLPADRSLTFVSGAPNFFRANVERMLQETGFNFTSVWLKAKSQPTFDYKLSTVRAILDPWVASQPEQTFILVGDDTEVDALVYASVANAMPENIAAVYIRRVSGRVPPLFGGQDVRKSQRYFTTAFDIALAELAKFRLDEAQAERVGQATLSDPDEEAFFPIWMACPPADYLSEMALEGYSARLRELGAKIRARVAVHCAF